MKLTFEMLINAYKKAQTRGHRAPIKTISWREYVLTKSMIKEQKFNALGQPKKLEDWQEYLNRLGRKLGQ